MNDVKFYLVRPRANGYGKIEMKFSYGGGRRLYMSTGISVRKDHWDKDRQRIAKKFQFHPDSDGINEMLNDLANEVNRVYGEHFRARKLINLTPNRFQAIIKVWLKGGQESVQVGLVDHFQDFVNRRKNEGKLSKATLKTYNTTLRHFTSFQKQQNYRLTFDDATFLLFEKFRDYLWNLGTIADGSVYKNLSRLKRVLKDGINRQYTDGAYFRDIEIATDLGVSSGNADHFALYMDELIQIYKLDLSNDRSLETTRDLFLIGCFTGTRFSDWGKVDLGKVVEIEEVPMVEMYTRKGKVRVLIPLHWIVQEIGKKYSNKLPKVKTNQVYNRQLKEIGKLVGFDDEITYKRRLRGKEQVVKAPKWSLITTHTARRSFATNGVLAGIPENDLMAITGHTKIQTFRVYAKEPLKMRAARVGSSDFFTKRPEDL